MLLGQPVKKKTVSDVLTDWRNIPCLKKSLLSGAAGCVAGGLIQHFKASMSLESGDVRGVFEA